MIQLPRARPHLFPSTWGGSSSLCDDLFSRSWGNFISQMGRLHNPESWSTAVGLESCWKRPWSSWERNGRPERAHVDDHQCPDRVGGSQWTPAGMEAKYQASAGMWTWAAERQKWDSYLLPTSPVAKPWARRVEREKALRWLSLFKLVKFLPTAGSDEGFLQPKYHKNKQYIKILLYYVYLCKYIIIFEFVAWEICPCRWSSLAYDTYNF